MGGRSRRVWDRAGFEHTDHGAPMTTTQIAILVGVVVASDLIIVPAIIAAAMRSCALPLAERFPAREVEGRAIRREFQSFSFGMVSMGWAMHVTADATHLHLSPSWVARRFRVRAASIPWDEIEVQRVRGRTATVRIRSMRIGEIKGPRWCLERREPLGA